MSSFKNLYIIIFKKINNKLGAKSLVKHIIDPRHTYKKARLLKDSCIKGTLIKIKSEPEKEHAIISKSKCAAVQVGKNGIKPKMVSKKKMHFNFVPFLDNPFMWLKGLYKNVYIDDDERIDTKYKVLRSSVCSLPSVNATNNNKLCTVHKNVHKKVLRSKSDTPVFVREKSFSPLSTDLPSVKNISVVTKDISCSTLDERSILATCLCVLPIAQNKMTFKDMKEQQINDKLKIIESNDNKLEENLGFASCLQTFKTYSSDLNNLLANKSQDTVPLTVLHVNVEDIKHQMSDPESSKEQAMTKILSLNNDDKIKLTLLMEADDSQNNNSSSKIGKSKIVVTQRKPDCLEQILNNYNVNLLSTLEDYDFSSLNRQGGKKKPPKKETNKDKSAIIKMKSSTSTAQKQQPPLSKTTASTKQNSANDVKIGTAQQQKQCDGSQEQWQMAPMQTEQMYYYWPTQAYNEGSMWQNYSQQQQASDTKTSKPTKASNKLSDSKNSTPTKQANETTQSAQMYPVNYMEAYSYNAYGMQQNPQHQAFEQSAQQVYSQMMQQTNANEQQFQMMQQSNEIKPLKKTVAPYTEKICALSKLPEKQKKSAKKTFTDTLIQLLNIPNKQPTSSANKQQQPLQQSTTEVKQNSFGEPSRTTAQTSPVTNQKNPTNEICTQETSTQPLVLAASFMPLAAKQVLNPIEAQPTAYNPSAWGEPYEGKLFSQQSFQQPDPQQQLSTAQVFDAANVTAWQEFYNKIFNQQTPEQISQQAHWHLVQKENEYLAQQAQWNMAQQSPEQLMYQTYEPKTYPQPQEHIQLVSQPQTLFNLTFSGLKVPQEHIEQTIEQTTEPTEPPKQTSNQPVVYSQGNTLQDTTSLLQQTSYKPGNSQENTPQTFEHTAGQTFEQTAGQTFEQTAGQTFDQTAGQTFAQTAGQAFAQTSGQTFEQSAFPQQTSHESGNSQENTQANTQANTQVNTQANTQATSEKETTPTAIEPSSNKETVQDDFLGPVRDWEKKNKDLKLSKMKKGDTGAQNEISKTAIKRTPILNAAKIEKPAKSMTMATSSSIERNAPSKPVYPIVAKPSISEPTFKTRSHLVKKTDNQSIRSAVNIPKILKKTNILRDFMTKTNGSFITQQNNPWQSSDPFVKSVQNLKKTASKQDNFGIAKNTLLVKQIKKSWQQNSQKKSNVASLKNDKPEKLTSKQADKCPNTDNVATVAKENIIVKEINLKNVPNFQGKSTTKLETFVKIALEPKQDTSGKTDMSIAKQDVTPVKKENTSVKEKEIISQGIAAITQQKMPEISVKSATQNQQQLSSEWSQNTLQALFNSSAKWNEQQTQKNTNLKEGNNATVEQQQQLQLQQQQFSSTDWQNSTTTGQGQHFYQTTAQQQLATPQEYSAQINNTTTQQNNYNSQTNPWQQLSSHQYHTLNEAIAKQKLTPVQSEHELQENYKLLDAYSMFDPRTDLYRVKNIKPKTPELLKRNEVNFVPKYKSGLIDKVEKHFFCWKQQFFDKSTALHSSRNISIIKQFEETLEQIKNIDKGVSTIDKPETFLPIISLIEIEKVFINNEQKLKADDKKVVANQVSRPVAEENETPKVIVRQEMKPDDMELLSKIDTFVDVKPKNNSEKSGITTNDSFLLPKQLKDFPNIGKRKLHIMNVENVDLEEMCRHSSLLLNCRIVLDGSERNEPNTTLHAKVYDYNRKRRDGLIITPRHRNKK